MIIDSSERIRHYTKEGYWGNDNLNDIFKAHVSKYRKKTALVDPPNKHDLLGVEPVRIPYEDLDRIIDTVATNLIQKGIEKDDVIIIQLPNSWELAVAYLAISRAGGITSPIPVQWRSAELKYVANLTKAKMYISTEDFKGYDYLQMAKELKDELPYLDHIVPVSEFRSLTEGSTDEQLLEKVKPSANDIFTICWTSGTEAEPKGCPLTHNNWISQGWLIVPAGCQAGDTQLCVAPLVNMAAIGVNFMTWLIQGGTLVLHHPMDIELAVKQIMDEKVNYVLFVPAILNAIAKHPRVDEFDLSSIRSIVTGSAPPSIWSLQEFRRRWSIEVLNMWGQNEGTFFGSVDDVPNELEIRADVLPWWGKKGVNWPSEQVSKWVKAVETKIVDPETGKELTAVGDVGHLLYRGPNVTAGYFKQPKVTKNSYTEDGYFYTGDLFEIRENNYVKFFDRYKDIIIRGGYNISAQEIENLIHAHPKVLDVAAVAMPDEILGEKVCIYVVPRPDTEIKLSDLTSFMKGKGIAVYKLPERMELIDEIPRNPVGKILKAKLREDLKKRQSQQVT